MGRYTKHCERCPYKGGSHLETKYKIIERGISPTDYEINGSDTLIVLQSPGYVEWEKGKPLQNCVSDESACTRITNSWIRKGFEREGFDIANVVLCYQGSNGKGDANLEEEVVAHCSKRLKDLIIKNKYKKIIVFGSPARREVEKIYAELNLNIEIICERHPCARDHYRPSDTNLDSLW